ncbi:KAP family P-loop NTPase fold protein [Ruegeria meonggei]|uniref:KAP family P-loop domain protein n=1 Tax=Ruegeria meonggei TaxID=1446476 RepID=A0A1X6ZK53_9RHOB|nr:P-loop NTPase fold protein [Ruegeria meonggei]SLN53955.1 KAP family P-loop domain protein [Ruegeria meonggei]
MTVDATANFKLLLDVPEVENLALDFGRLADTFAQIVTVSEPRFAIAVYGSWGSGKTTLMRAIDARLDPNLNASVWFSAWRYEKEEHLLVPMLDVIREGVLKWSDRTSKGQAKNAAIKLARVIGGVTSSLVAGLSAKAKIPGFAEFSFDANKALTAAEKLDDKDIEARTPRSFYHASFNALQAAFAAFSKMGASKIVVFVDDLDRCLPEKTLEVLESMKLFFDLSGFVFVAGLDRDVVELAIEHRYSKFSGEKSATATRLTGERYLQKIFQVQFSFPPVNVSETNDLLTNIINGAGLKAPQKRELEKTVRPFVAELTTESGFNPREFKRFINNYTLQRKINPHLNKEIVLAIQVIGFRPDWASVATTLQAYRDVFVRALGTYRDSGSLSELEGLMIDGGRPPATFLKFISDDKLGGKLAKFKQTGENYSIDDYLFSGEATQGTDTSVIDAIQAVAALRGSISEIPNKSETRLSDVLSEVGSQANQAAERMLSNPAMAPIQKRLGDLSSRCRVLPLRQHLKDPEINETTYSDLNEEGQSSIMSLETERAQIMQELQQYYRTF